MDSHVSYLGNLTPKMFNNTIKRMVNLIKVNYPNVNVLAGCGLSGSMIIPALAAKLKIEWAIVRKDKDDSHSDIKTELSALEAGNKGVKVNDSFITNIVFIDDLIDTGKTYKKVKRAVKAKYAKICVDAVFLGAALYENYKVIKDDKV